MKRQIAVKELEQYVETRRKCEYYNAKVESKLDVYFRKWYEINVKEINLESSEDNVREYVQLVI